MEWIIVDDFKQRAFKQSLDIGYEITNIFYLEETDTANYTFQAYTFVFRYKDTLLTFSFSPGELGEDLFTQHNCQELEEVIEEFEDLCLLRYKHTKYNFKFISFISEQLEHRYLTLWEQHYANQGDDRIFQNEVKQFISELDKLNSFPMDFYKLYKIIMKDFIPNRGQLELVTESRF